MIQQPEKWRALQVGAVSCIYTLKLETPAKVNTVLKQWSHFRENVNYFSLTAYCLFVFHCLADLKYFTLARK